MWSFPNFVPLSAPRVNGVLASLAPFGFDRIHGAFDTRTIWQNGKSVLAQSANRYLDLIRGDGNYELQERVSRPACKKGGAVGRRRPISCIRQASISS